MIDVSKGKRKKTKRKKEYLLYNMFKVYKEQLN